MKILYNKKANMFVAMIIVLVLAAFFVYTIFYGFVGAALFGGVVYEGASQIHEGLEEVCESTFFSGETKEIIVLIPDRTGETLKARQYYYVSIHNRDNQAKELRLNSRAFVEELLRDCETVEGITSGACLDVDEKFVDWAKDNQNQRKLKSHSFDNCADWAICANADESDFLTNPCGEFSFEPADGMNNLILTVTKDVDMRRIYVDYERAGIEVSQII